MNSIMNPKMIALHHRNFGNFSFFFCVVTNSFFRARDETSVPEDGECSDTYLKSKYHHKKRSVSSSSRSSRSSSRSRSKKKKKIMPKQYKDSSRSSSSGSRNNRGHNARRQSPSPLPGKRKVYIDYDRSKEEEKIFGTTYIPPAGFCDECNER